MEHSRIYMYTVHVLVGLELSTTSVTYDKAEPSYQQEQIHNRCGNRHAGHRKVADKESSEPYD